MHIETDLTLADTLQYAMAVTLDVKESAVDTPNEKVRGDQATLVTDIIRYATARAAQLGVDMDDIVVFEGTDSSAQTVFGKARVIEELPLEEVEQFPFHRLATYARRVQGLTQQVIVERVAEREVTLSAPNLSRYERGTGCPRRPVFNAWRDALGYPPGSKMYELLGQRWEERARGSRNSRKILQ